MTGISKGGTKSLIGIISGLDKVHTALPLILVTVASFFLLRLHLALADRQLIPLNVRSDVVPSGLEERGGRKKDNFWPCKDLSFLRVCTTTSSVCMLLSELGTSELNAQIGAMCIEARGNRRP